MAEPGTGQVLGVWGLVGAEPSSWQDLSLQLLPRDPQRPPHCPGRPFQWLRDSGHRASTETWPCRPVMVAGSPSPSHSLRELSLPGCWGVEGEEPAVVQGCRLAPPSSILVPSRPVAEMLAAGACAGPVRSGSTAEPWRPVLEVPSAPRLAEGRWAEGVPMPQPETLWHRDASLIVQPMHGPACIPLVSSPAEHPLTSPMTRSIPPAGWGTEGAQPGPQAQDIPLEDRMPIT